MRFEGSVLKEGLQTAHGRQSKFPTEFNGHGLLVKDSIRDYTKLQEEPECPLSGAPS